MFITLSMQTTHPSLTMDIRLSIIKDVYQGVAYLHADKPPFIYQDIKSYVYEFICNDCFNNVCKHNVLLDSNFVAKVGDFGFCLELPQSESGRTMFTAPLISTTEGYFPPELATGKISPLCDVYRCGVVSDNLIMFRVVSL